MVRSPSVDKNGLKRGAWSEEEDNKLRAYVQRYGHWNWRQLPKFAGLARCGKSCRLRWMNYLKPGLKKGKYTKEEEEMIFKLHQELGNKWSTIAAELPGRTDNEIKNYWNGHLKNRMKQDPKSRRETKEISQNVHVMDQIEQDSSISLLESSDWKMELKANYISAADADASTEEISSPSYNCSTLSFITSKESFPKFFESFWSEPFSPSTSYSQISSHKNENLDESYMKSFQSLSTEADSSNVLDGLISPSASCKSTEQVSSNASNDLISPSTCYQFTFSNSEEPSVDDSFGDFWTEPFSFDTSYNSQSIHQLPQAEQGVMFPFSSILECDFDMFNQF